MNNRQRVHAVMHYENYDRLPCVAFGYWGETLKKWADEGYISHEVANAYCRYGDNSEADHIIMDILGFDFNFQSCVSGLNNLMPPFERKVLKTENDGSQIVQQTNGHIVHIKQGIGSIPGEVGTLLTDRGAWDKEYKPRLQYSSTRVDEKQFANIQTMSETRDNPLWLHCGSLYGEIRDMIGIEQLSYIMADDEDLYIEIIDTMADLAYQVVKEILQVCPAFDGAHFWEDICYNNGPLISPAYFKKYVGHHYRRFADLLNTHGIDQISVDCDGCIDKLIPIWLDNGVNTMFPIEVGTWKASIAPWRQQYGKCIKGVGGMDKSAFSKDKAAIDAEIERLKPLVDLGGYIPCPDHRIPPDAKFELVTYYCDLFRKAF